MWYVHFLSVYKFRHEFGVIQITVIIFIIIIPSYHYYERYYYYYNYYCHYNYCYITSINIIIDIITVIIIIITIFIIIIIVIIISYPISGFTTKVTGLFFLFKEIKSNRRQKTPKQSHVLSSTWVSDMLYVNM